MADEADKKNDGGEADSLAAANRAGAAKAPEHLQGQLLQNGPTVEEFVKAGYLAVNYPPAGYASRSTEAEIKAEVAKAGTPQPGPGAARPNAGAIAPEPAPGTAMVRMLFKKQVRVTDSGHLVHVFEPGVKDVPEKLAEDYAWVFKNHGVEKVS